MFVKIRAHAVPQPKQRDPKAAVYDKDGRRVGAKKRGRRIWREE